LPATQTLVLFWEQMSTWDDVLIGLDARAEGREAEATEILADAIDVQWVRHTCSRWTGRPYFWSTVREAASYIRASWMLSQRTRDMFEWQDESPFLFPSNHILATRTPLTIKNLLEAQRRVTEESARRYGLTTAMLSWDPGETDRNGSFVLRSVNVAEYAPQRFMFNVEWEER